VLDYIRLYEYVKGKAMLSQNISKGLHMVTIDEDSRKYFQEKLTGTQALRIFFGGYG
jgi:hypothetical protein